MLTVDTADFLIVVSASALAAVLVGFAGKRVIAPVVVVELLLGILIGPGVLGIADVDSFITFFSNLGLGMLFFFAGYEIDFQRIKGASLKLAIVGWLLSLVIAYSIGGILAATGVILSVVFVGSATATTAIGTLIPIMNDAGELKTRFGTFLLAAGAVGEFGPILLITFAFSTVTPLTSGLLVMLFIGAALVAALVAVRSVGAGWETFERALETSSQLPVRAAVVLIFTLAYLAAELGLDLLLGGFVAGIIVRLALRGREVQILESKLTALGYGFLIPFFFVVSGMNFDIDALTSDPGKAILVPSFLLIFLLVRGIPALTLYRGVMAGRDRFALALLSSTQLPLVVAITTIAIEQGHMVSSTAASLVAAAVLSTAIFPLVALRLRRDPPAGGA